MYEQFGNYNGFNPYPQMQRSVVQPQGLHTQTIQSITQPVQQQIVTYFVKSANELASIQVVPNVLYLGINGDGKELYVRKMNLDGNVELETYGLINGTKEKTEIQTITEKIEEMKQMIAAIGGKHDTTDVA